MSPELRRRIPGVRRLSLAFLVFVAFLLSGCAGSGRTDSLPGLTKAWHPKPLGSSRAATVARKLARADDLHLGALPPGMTPKATRSAAVATALKEYGKPPPTNVSAFAAWS